MKMLGPSAPRVSGGLAGKRATLRGHSDKGYEEGDLAMQRNEHPSWLHRYASFIAFCTFLLIIAGALVTGNDAGLSVPDWPTSFGSFRMPRMVGGVKFEHGHRMIAGAVGILTILLVIALWVKDSRRWVRWVGFAAVTVVAAQALLGGITVLFHLPVAVSAAHATLAQIFFCLAASLAFFTRPDWRWDEAKLDDPSSPSLQQLAAAATGAILVQLALGAVYRHAGLGVVPHAVGAAVVTLLAAWVVSRILAHFAQQPALMRPALLLGGLLMAQIVLGVESYILKTAARGTSQPLPPLVGITTTHVAMGALTLVTSLYLTYQTHRFLAPRKEAREIASSPHQATT
jgi:cytochrome c oxidase assembly protein subunit 15